MQHEARTPYLDDLSIALAPRVIVLDVESRPLERDEPLQRLVSRAREQIVLNTITAAAVLVVDTDADQAETQTVIGTEGRILEGLDAILRQHERHALITFNGARFDVPLLQVRALHHGLARLSGIGGLANKQHLDLMRAMRCRCSLEALGAALNLTGDELAVGADPEEKCRADVIHTYLCAAYLAGFQAGDMVAIRRTIDIQDRLVPG